MNAQIRVYMCVFFYKFFFITIYFLWINWEHIPAILYFIFFVLFICYTYCFFSTFLSNDLLNLYSNAKLHFLFFKCATIISGKIIL